MQGRLRDSRITISRFTPVTRQGILRRPQHIAWYGVGRMGAALGITGLVEMRGIFHCQTREVVDVAHREVLQKLPDYSLRSTYSGEGEAHLVGKHADVLDRFIPGQAEHQSVQFAFPSGLYAAGQFLI